MASKGSTDKSFQRSWVGLDNAGKIFLSTMTAADTKVFRLTACLKHKVRPDLLQEALDLVYPKFPLYHATIRRGLFWYFMEDTNLEPQVEEESTIPCAQIYRSGYRGLLFRVLYRENRIHLEVFHALSDGSGAMTFFQALLLYYANLYFKDLGQNVPIPLPSPDPIPGKEDSFITYFAKEKNRSPLDLGKDRGPISRIKGPITPDARQNIVEVSLPLKPALQKAKVCKASLTTYLSALYMKALYRTLPSKKRDKKDQKIVLSCPVDLRRLYPNHTVRNFFATVMLPFTFKAGHEASTESICQSIGPVLKQSSGKDYLDSKVRTLVHFEKSLPVRLLPLYVKDVGLRLINNYNNLSITGAITNLGAFPLPPAMDAIVDHMIILSSAVRPQVSIISYGDKLTLTINSPLASTQFQEAYLEILAEEGLLTEEAEELHRSFKEEKEDKGTKSPSSDPYPPFPARQNYPLAAAMLLFGSIGTSLLYLILYALDLIHFSYAPVALALLTVVLVVTGILRNRHNPVWLVTLQSMILSLGAVAIDFAAGFRGWSISWALPGIFSGSIIAGEIVMAVSSEFRARGALFNLSSIGLALLPLLFMLLAWAKPIWPSIVTVVLALLSLTLGLIFRRKHIAEEGKRKWFF